MSRCSVVFPVRSATLTVYAYECEAAVASGARDRLRTDQEALVRRFLRDHADAEHVRVVAHTTERKQRGYQTILVCAQTVVYAFEREYYAVV
jgi:hypothetical protein